MTDSLGRQVWRVIGFIRSTSGFFQFQTSVSNHLEVIFVIGQYLADSSVAAWLLAVWHFFFSPFCNSCFLLLLGNVHPNFRPYTVWSGSFGIFVGLPFTHLYPSRCLVRGIWNLEVPIHSSERVTPFASVLESWMRTSTYFNGIENVSSSGSQNFKRGSS